MNFQEYSNNNGQKQLYPYHSRVLRGIFMYGTDYKRGFDIFRVSKSVKIVVALLLSLFFVAIIILRAIRRRFRLLGNSVGSCAMDCLILFIGGGNLEMRHRFERWFFGILMVGAFFIVSVFGGDLVDSVVTVLNSKFDTFEDLVEINPPIYIDPTLSSQYTEICDMLR